MNNPNLHREELALKLENIGIAYCILAKAVRANQPFTAEAMHSRIIELIEQATSFAAAPGCNINLH